MRVEDWRAVLNEAQDIYTLLRGERDRLNRIARRIGVDKVTAVVIRNTNLQCVRALETGYENALPGGFETCSTL